MEAFLANEDHIRKVELMQTLVARNQAMVRDIIKQEKSKQNPDAKKIGKLREEIDRLYSLTLLALFRLSLPCVNPF